MTPAPHPPEAQGRIESSGQWCELHNCHQDDPAHPYQYPECERHLRLATPQEEAALGSGRIPEEGEGGAWVCAKCRHAHWDHGTTEPPRRNCDECGEAMKPYVPEAELRRLREAAEACWVPLDELKRIFEQQESPAALEIQKRLDQLTAALDPTHEQGGGE